MKNKLIALLASAGLVATASAIDINENLSITGFIDGSYKHVDNDTLGTKVVGGDASTTDQSLGFDEAELNFLTNVGNVNGVINIDTDTFNSVELEQAHVTYSLENGVSFTLGKFGSALGFEREDPTGLYTFSRAYSAGSGFNLGNIDGHDAKTGEDIHVVEGLNIAYSGGDFGINAAFVNGADADGEEDELDLELSFSYTGIENLSLGGGYYFDNEADSADENDVLNIHIATEMGKFFLAAEYIEMDSGTGKDDLDGYMILADYDFNEKLGVVFRVSSNEQTNDGDYDKITIAPNYSITESFGAILEYSDVEKAGDDGNELALEFLYTF